MPHMPVSWYPVTARCVAAGVTDRSQILKNVRNAIRGKFPLYNLGFGQNVDFNFLEVMSMENNGRAQRIYEDHDATQQLQVSLSPLTPNALPAPCHGEPSLGNHWPISLEEQIKLWHGVRISYMTSRQLVYPHKPVIPPIKWRSKHCAL